MKSQLRPKVPVRSGSIWVAVFFLLILSGTVVTYGMNNHAAPVTDKVEIATASKSPPSLSSGNTKRFIVVIDPGHGGNDPGADGVSGIKEKEFTLSLSEKVYELLKKDPNFDPQMTRTDDTFVDLTDRAKFANDLHAEAFLSIHANFYKDSGVSGTETFYYSDSSSSLAEALHRNVVSAMGFKDREVRKRKLKVLTNSDMPAALLEVGYLTNAKEEAAMISPDGQTRTAEAIVAGLKQYFAETQHR
jgi:N-acetylmuramoyl-L-alanine amidase